MKIAVISTTVLPSLPPSKGGYGGLEPLAWQQAAGLAKRGHQVLLVAPKGSEGAPGVELHETTPCESEKAAYSGYWQRLLEVEAVIDNSWTKWSYILKSEGRLKGPVLGVLHTTVNTMYNKPPPVPKPCLVAISKDQAGHVYGHLGIRARTIYNGVDLSVYRSSGASRNERYLFLARISRLKGPHVAVGAAQATGVPLDVVGDDRLVEDLDYAKKIKESCDPPDIVYHGEKKRSDCVKFFSKARALLHCAMCFREPFGLTMIEAAACECPVIAFDHGSLREVVSHGETGFLVRTPEEMEDLIRQNAVKSIKPEACLSWAERFSNDRMIDGYETAILEAVQNGGW